ncbi:MAG: hypothetical protein Q9180_005104 [Flavoplaca navasiana]
MADLPGTALVINRYAEISAGIICGCMPVVPGLWKHIRERFEKKQTDGTSNSPGDRRYGKQPAA